MNVVLIGPRGSGKTKIGKMLSRKLGRKLISTDNLITNKALMPISHIVKKDGWEKFRGLESEVLEEIACLDNSIIDTGGGSILRKRNIYNLKRNGFIILLTANIDTLINRIKGDNSRPSLTGHKSFIEEIGDILKERKEKYEKAADYIIDTSNLTPNQVVNKIIELLRLC
jgi:shikimate kinase